MREQLQSLPGAYDKGLLALRFPSEPLVLLSQWEGRSACHHLVTSYPSPLMDLFTGSNTAESSNFQDDIRQYNSLQC